MLAISNRLFQKTICAAGAALIALPLLAHDIVLPGVAEDQFDDAVAIHATFDGMVQSVAEEDAGEFVGLFAKIEDGSFYDNEGTKFEGAAAILARMGQLFGITPPDATYTASTPRILLWPDGDMDAAWLTADWSWAVWEGHASALMKREEGEWRFFRIDFFGVKLVIPDADMDPQPANATIAAATATVDSAAAALSACDVPALQGMVTPTFQVVEHGVPATDPVEAVLRKCDSDLFDEFDPAVSVVYIDAQTGVAVVYDPNGQIGALHLVLSEDAGDWLVAATAYGTRDVSARDRLFMPWARIKGD